MSGFERIKEEKKRRIRIAAQALFFEQGYRSVKVSEIATAAEVSQVTLYNHFGSKEALFRDFMMDYYEQKYNQYEEIRTSNLPFKEKIKMIFTDKVKEAKRFNPELLQQVFNDPLLVQYIQKFNEEKGIPFVVGLIKEGQEAGAINPSLSHEAIMFYLNMFESEATRQLDTFSIKTWSTFVSDLISLLIYGLIGNPKAE